MELQKRNKELRNKQETYATAKSRAGASASASPSARAKSMARTGMCAKLLGRTLEPKKLAKLPVVSKSVPYPSEWSSGRAARGLDHVPP